MKPIQLAGCVILDDYGRLLLSHRRDDGSGLTGQWELPGGKVESGESPEAAAVRELYEELGVRVHLVKSLGTGNFEYDERDFVYHWFQATIIGGEPAVQEPDTFDDVDYFELEDTPSLALSANMLVLLPKIDSGEVALD